MRPGYLRSGLGQLTPPAPLAPIETSPSSIIGSSVASAITPLLSFGIQYFTMQQQAKIQEEQLKYQAQASAQAQQTQAQQAQAALQMQMLMAQQQPSSSMKTSTIVFIIGGLGMLGLLIYIFAKVK